MDKGSQRPGEFELIDRYFRPLAGRAGLGLRDDVALLSPDAGTELVVTMDAIVEGFDFLPDDPPEAIAAKALRVNLSDLAAMGARPLAYFLTLALPGTVEESWVAGFAAGLALRFARVLRYRDDKSAAEADTIETVRELYGG